MKAQEELVYIEQELNAKEARLAVLRIQAAQQFPAAPPAVTIEIHSLEKEVNLLRIERDFWLGEVRFLKDIEKKVDKPARLCQRCGMIRRKIIPQIQSLADGMPSLVNDALKQAKDYLFMARDLAYQPHFVNYLIADLFDGEDNHYEANIYCHDSVQQKSDFWEARKLRLKSAQWLWQEPDADKAFLKQQIMEDIHALQQADLFSQEMLWIDINEVRS